jgi:(p)ppGpp synthase/HD superfamily hydrolase
MSRPGSNTTARPKIVLGPLFEDAFLYAAEKHGKQAKKGTGVPYIAHLMGVCALVLEAGGDEEVAIAALLHDVVEDCGGRPTLREVKQQFGQRVAHIVEGCTDSYVQPKPAWSERKLKYLRHLRAADGDVRLVSTADKLYNARSILTDYKACGESVWSRFQGGREGTLWYYGALAEELSRAKPNRLVGQLVEVVSELDRQAAMRVDPDRTTRKSRRAS